MQEKKKITDTERIITSVICDRPLVFELEGYDGLLQMQPVTLGMHLLLRETLDDMQVDDKLLKANVTLEYLRLCTEEKERCALLVAQRCCTGKAEIFGARAIQLQQIFMQQPADILATLLTAALQDVNLQEIEEYLRIDREMRLLQRAERVRKNKNTLTFGGVSLWGNLIDAACEKYGWTLDYVVWGISYANLQMMLADSVKTVYLSDKELKRCGMQVNRQRGRQQDGVRAESLTADEVKKLRFK